MGADGESFCQCPPMEQGTDTCNSTSRDCALVPGRAHRWQDHITECTEGATPGSQGSQPQQRNPKMWVWHRNRGLLDLRVFSGLDSDAQKIQGPSFSKRHIILLDSYVTLRKEPSSN